ncbi:GTP 3',8-cyclase MoaA [Thalassolituus sp. C2-1]|jgi:cyclic pyranopterin phosphate synthase|uniref:GTP 3',8-cyclase MoaA n=1 Tax=Venatorbacter sp. C2-1 TaxID=2597518 RepID=UPI000C5BC3FC|nr:GTP 3',8-cyclase MoaA [Thalassolituus sp. C2-1]PIQ39500.1 MAG: GTP 3',8-cyclase MoaA [Thalassolituus sp. CG17_big_fil_post_rev_8_21_14_2_50_53_8]TVV44962.1 GTP 3',8-cyclase MoaA [Thalassolituus sp. C2-1]
MLTDRFARRFTYLRLSLTERCNFRCTYCLPEGNDCDTAESDLNIHEVRRLLTAFARLGTRKVRLTGGEPALRRDLSEIISLCKSVPGIEQVALTTNGYNLQKEISGWKKAGLDALNISVDSLDPAIFSRITGADRLHYILQGIDQALQLNFQKVKLNTVLLRQHNTHSLPGFLRFIKDRPVSLRFIELMRTNDNAGFYQEQHLSGEFIRQQLTEDGWQLQPKATTDGPALEYAHPDYAGRVGLIMPYSKDFCSSCNRLRVSSKGELFLCLFADEHQSLRELLQSDDPAPVEAFLQRAIGGKEESHYLHQQRSGQTRHLAMIGG